MKWNLLQSLINALENIQHAVFVNLGKKSDIADYGKYILNYLDFQFTYNGYI